MAGKRTVKSGSSKVKKHVTKTNSVISNCNETNNLSTNLRPMTRQISKLLNEEAIKKELSQGINMVTGNIDRHEHQTISKNQRKRPIETGNKGKTTAIKAEDVPINEAKKDTGDFGIKSEINNQIDEKIKPQKKKTRKAHITIEDEPIVDSANAIKSEKWFPNNFQEIYNNIKEMRTWMQAPVEAMEGNLAGKAAGPDERFQILFSLMLSAQTRDTLTITKMKQLKEKGLNLQYVLDIEESKLAEELKPVNFYPTKAKNIKKTAEIIKNKFGGDIPKTIEDLTSLPGVGPKMGYLCLLDAWNISEGIGVDTHVHRLSNLFKWVRKPTKQPEETRKELESWLPKELWIEFNKNLVGFGQTICIPQKPRCEKCLNNKICPGAFKTPQRKNSKA